MLQAIESGRSSWAGCFCPCDPEYVTKDAWGNLEVGADQPGYAFTGREWDPEIGLYYYRARYYDPEVGRFISEDPIGFDGGINFYGYVEQNPVLLVDPLGLRNLNLLPIGSPQHRAASVVPEDPAALRLFIHGYPGAVVDGQGNKPTPGQVAALLMFYSWWDQPQTVEILACRNGAIPQGAQASFAEEVARLMGRPVIATTGYVSYTAQVWDVGGYSVLLMNSGTYAAWKDRAMTIPDKFQPYQ